MHRRRSAVRFAQHRESLQCVSGVSSLHRPGRKEAPRLHACVWANTHRLLGEQTRQQVQLSWGFYYKIQEPLESDPIRPGAAN